MQRSFTVLLVDAAEASRAQIRYYLAEFPIFTIVEEASSLDGMIAAIGQHHPDCIILDDTLLDGLETEVLAMFNSDFSGRMVLLTASTDARTSIVRNTALALLFKPVSRPRFVALFQGIRDLFLLEEAEQMHRQE